MKNNYLNQKKGFTIIEVLIACLVISITVFSLMFAATKGIELSFNAIKQTQSSYLLEEGVEAVKTIRDDSWTSINNLAADGNTKYYLYFNPNTNKWELNQTETKIDSTFTREVLLSYVYRDGSDDIASSGTLDNDIRKVTINVLFNSASGLNTNSLSFYVTNIFE